MADKEIMKGQEPLPYTAKEIMETISYLGDMFVATQNRTDPDIEHIDKEYLEAWKELQAIAYRFEYMNLHFNPIKSATDGPTPPSRPKYPEVG